MPLASRPGNQSFGRERRLRKRGQFLATYEAGQRAHGRLAVVFGARRDDRESWRLGLTATRKLGGAVVRNRLRRQGREIFRRWGERLPAGWDFVLNFKHGAAQASQADLKADLLRCLRRLGIDPEPAEPGRQEPPCDPAPPTEETNPRA
jgi:ribonuclease P protein component